MSDPKTIRLHDVEVVEYDFKLIFDSCVVSKLYNRYQNEIDIQILAFAEHGKPMPYSSDVKERVEEHLMRILDQKVNWQFGVLAQYAHKEIREPLEGGDLYGLATIRVVKP